MKHKKHFYKLKKICDQRAIPDKTLLFKKSDKSSDEEGLSLLIQFSKPEEMRKACEILSDISCTILNQSAVNTCSTADDCKSKLNECTKRECEVLNMLAKGYSYSETAVYLNCKVSTVQTHVKHLYSKLGVHSKSEAVYEALHLGLVEI